MYIYLAEIYKGKFFGDGNNLFGSIKLEYKTEPTIKEIERDTLSSFKEVPSEIWFKTIIIEEEPEYTIDKFYSMKFDHHYASGELEFFKETTDDSILYWINAKEEFKNKEECANIVAIKFTKAELERLKIALKYVQ